MTTYRRPVAILAAAVLLLLSVPLAAARASTSPKPVTNPDLAASCGTDVTIVIDRSGSIGNDNTTVQQAAQTFVDALIGTGSKVQVVSFSDRATAEPGHGANLTDLAFTDPSTLSVPTFTSAGSTNWDDALEMVRRSPAGHAPLTVMITDGDPTRHNSAQPDGHGGTLAGSGGSTSQADLDAAVTEANAIKGLSGHLFVVGVGSAVSNATSEGRIQDISGPDKLTFTGATPNISFGKADYTLVTQFAALKTTVAHFVRELCGPSLNVVKKLQLTDGKTVAAGANDVFTFTASASPAASAWTAPAQGPGAGASLSTTNGVANFAWDPATPDSSTTVTLAEQAKADWVYNGERCWLNNLDGTPAQLVVDHVGVDAVGASKPATVVLPAVGPYQAMNCEVFNRQVRPATISVDKVTDPGGRPESFSFALHHADATVGTLSGITDASAPTAFPPVAPGTYDVVEGSADHFTQSAATCDDLATDTVEHHSATGLVVSEAAHWQCTFTNTLHPGTLRVVKVLHGAPSGTFDFTSNVPGHPSFTLQPSAGHDAVMTLSAAAGSYTVAEGAHAPYALTAMCDNDSTPAHVAIRPDVTTTCTFTNTAPAPTIVVTKSAATDVVPEPGGNVTYTVTITNTSVEPLTISSIADTVGGSTFDVLGLPAGRTTCLPLAGTSVAPGGTVQCTFSAPVSGNANHTVTDKVDVQTKDSDGNVAAGSATASVRISDVAPTILVNKSTVTPVIPEPGGPVVFQVAVTNTSNEGVTLTSLTDQIGAGAEIPLTAVGGPITATSCALVAIVPGGVATCSFTATISGGAGQVIGDTVRVGAIDDDGTSVHAAHGASVTLTDVLPSIAVTKTAGVTSVAEPGGDVTYTVGITNLTAEPVTLGSITDAVGGGTASAAGGTCGSLAGTTLAGSASTSCTFTVAVAGSAASGPVSDTVAVTAHDDDGHSVTVDASASVKISDVLPSITVTKTAASTSVDEPGGTVTFTIGVTNRSVEPVTIDALLDSVDQATPVDVTALPGTCHALVGASLAPQGTASCTFTLLVAGNGGATVGDVVTVSAGDDEGNQATGTARAAVHVSDVLPTIAVAKTAGVASVPEPGAPVGYTVAVSNHSVEPVTLTTLSDVVGSAGPVDVSAIAAGTCALPHTIAVGGTFTCGFSLPVVGSGGAAVTDVVTAVARDDEEHDATATGTATVQVTHVTPGPVVTDLAIVKAATIVPTVGQTGRYSLTVTNRGPAAAVDVSVTDPMPAFLSATSATGDGWTCTIAPAGAGITCTRPTLAAGQSAAIVVDVAVGDPGLGVSVTNTATVSSPTPDPDPSNNTSSVTVLPPRLLDANAVRPTTPTTPTTVEAAASTLPKTGADIRRWIVLADMFLILGVALLLADVPRLRRAIGR